MELIGKKILLISPQPWGMLHLSKHHYALELAGMGNEVYFLSPPAKNIKSFNLEPICSGLYEIRHGLSFRSDIRFKVRSVFDFLMKRHVKKLMKWLAFKPDITWCFDSNIYSNLRWFGADLNIYHPVDPITRKDQVKPAYSADVIFSVSEQILSAFSRVAVPRYFINHGLSKPFELEAKKNLERLKHYKPSNPLKVGYVGNLLRPIIDRDQVLEIIQSNPGMKFHFWGPYEPNQSNIAGSNDPETVYFINKLKKSPNVVLHGPKPPEILAKEIQDMDLFYFTYKLVNGESDLSNSHKILEYLSTGKPIFACEVSAYNETGLLEQVEKLQILGGMRIALFSDRWQNSEMQNRIEYTMENTYGKQIERIQRYILIR